MYIKTIRISSFGPLCDKTLELSDGLNVIEGPNESGKSTVAAFIKFVFYGLSGRGTGGAISERRRYVSWRDGRAAGYIILVTDDGEFRVERELSVSYSDSGSRRESVRETVRILTLPAMEQIHKGEVPGEVFFGVPEGVFLNTAFVRQMSGARVDGGELGEAIENIMFSADEAVSADRAVERLEKSRRELLHKKGGGGMVSDLSARREALQVKMNSDRENVREIFSLEAALADCRRNMEDKQNQRDSLTGVLKAYDALSEYRKLTDTADTEAEMVRLRSELDELRRSAASYEYTARMKELSDVAERCADTARDLEIRRDQLAAELENAERAPLSEGIGDPEEIEADAVRLSRGAKICGVFGGVLVGLGGVALVIAVQLFLRGTFYLVPAAAAAAVLICAGVALAVSSAGKKKRLGSLLNKWDAASPDELAAAVRRWIRESDRVRSIETELRCTEISAGENETTRVETEQEILELAERLGIQPAEEDIVSFARSAADMSAEICARRDRVMSEYSTVSGRFSVLQEHFSGRDKSEVIAAGKAAEASPDGAAAMAMDPDGADAAKRARDFCAESLNALKAREASINEKLAALRAVTGSAAEDEENIRRLTREIDTLTERHDALCLAIETINKAGERLRRGVLPQIVERAASELREVSDGRYGDIGVGQDFGVTFTDDDVTRSAEYLSEGTKEMTYLCLRRALMKVMYGERNPPAVYDESFAGLDEGRLRRMTALLRRGGQSLLLTCRRLEAEIAAGDCDGVPPVSVLRLED